MKDMLIVSREAKVKAAKHAWNNYGRSSFGILLGSPSRLLLALPATSIQNWSEFRPDDFSEFFVQPAVKLAKSLHMVTLGFYASFGMGIDNIGTCPLENIGLFMHYEMICCPQCSGASFHLDGKCLPRASVIDAPGKRLTHFLNQRRVLSEWNRCLGRTSYLAAAPQQDKPGCANSPVDDREGI
jgi:hypothetical protein